VRPRSRGEAIQGLVRAVQRDERSRREQVGGRHHVARGMLVRRGGMVRPCQGLLRSVEKQLKLSEAQIQMRIVRSQFESPPVPFERFVDVPEAGVRLRQPPEDVVRVRRVLLG
jgi:hypothetical protein